MAERFCKNCGSQVGPNDKFCNNCGQALADQPGAAQPSAFVPLSETQSAFTPPDAASPVPSTNAAPPSGAFVPPPSEAAPPPPAAEGEPPAPAFVVPPAAGPAAFTPPPATAASAEPFVPPPPSLGQSVTPSAPGGAQDNRTAQQPAGPASFPPPQPVTNLGRGYAEQTPPPPGNAGRRAPVQPPPPYGSQATPQKKGSKGCLIAIIVTVVIVIILVVVVITMLSSATKGNGQTAVSATSRSATNVDEAYLSGPNTEEIEQGDLIYTEEFEDDTSGWDEWQGENSIGGYRDGKYDITVMDEKYFSWGNAYQDFDNFILTVEGKLVDGQDKSALGVILRYQDVDNFYLYAISLDAHYTFGYFLDNEWVPIIDWTESDLINQGQDTNTLGVAANGDHFILAINDEEVEEVHDSTLSHGDIGLLCSAGPGGTTVEFDNVNVWAIQ